MSNPKRKRGGWPKWFQWGGDKGYIYCFKSPTNGQAMSYDCSDIKCDHCYKWYLAQAEYFKKITPAQASKILKTEKQPGYSRWPRLRDLPEQIKEAFKKQLAGQTVPWIHGLPITEQDGYYQHDYDRWIVSIKTNKPAIWD